MNTDQLAQEIVGKIERVCNAAVALVTLPDELAYDGPREVVECSRAATSYARAVFRLAGARDLFGMEQPDLKTCAAVRLALYKAFGAPGDWGYSTPLGAALKALYETKIPE